MFLVVACACLLLLASFFLQGTRQSDALQNLRCEGCNVIFISIDTLRADHLGCYGHPFVKSPHIDRLAAEGVRFTNHFSAVSTTLSSHTTMMTGTYPHTHGVVRNGFVVHGDNLMMAEILGRAGFKTAGFVGAHPLFPATSFSLGFDHFDAPISAETGGEQRRAHQVTDAVLD